MTAHFYSMLFGLSVNSMLCSECLAYMISKIGRRGVTHLTIRVSNLNAVYFLETSQDAWHLRKWTIVEKWAIRKRMVSFWRNPRTLFLTKRTFFWFSCWNKLIPLYLDDSSAYGLLSRVIRWTRFVLIGRLLQERKIPWKSAVVNRDQKDMHQLLSLFQSFPFYG